MAFLLFNEPFGTVKALFAKAISSELDAKFIIRYYINYVFMVSFKDNIITV
jgi:ATP-dependent 26S proteasome regulatory subunit